MMKFIRWLIFIKIESQVVIKKKRLKKIIIKKIVITEKDCDKEDCHKKDSDNWKRLW